jgi:hypothetical protein
VPSWKAKVTRSSTSSQCLLMCRLEYVDKVICDNLYTIYARKCGRTVDEGSEEQVLMRMLLCFGFAGS